jgi:hypothetical protein
MIKRNITISSNLDGSFEYKDKSNSYLKDDEIFFPFDENEKDNDKENISKSSLSKNTKFKSRFEYSLDYIKNNIINNSTFASCTFTFLYENKVKYDTNSNY